MSFGQASGPPASAKQIRELLELLEAAGHSDFRDARGPMGFTQRQAGGKFTRDEADAFIEQLQSESEGAPAAPPPPPMQRAAARPATPSGPTPAGLQRALRTATDEQLADELRRRGWRRIEQ